MQVIGFGWTGILTQDYEASLHFFSELLGLPLEYQDSAKVISHFRLASGQLVEVYGPSNRQREDKYRWYVGPALGFEVDDLRRSRQAMIDKGVRFITEVETWEDEAWSMFLGPEDKALEIQSPKRGDSPNASVLRRLAWAGLPVQDFAAAVEFFTQTMDIPLAARDDTNGWARFQLPAGHVLEVFGPSSQLGQLTQHLAIGFEVEDVKQARAELAARGVEFVDDSETSRSGETPAFFRGPDGFLYRIERPLSRQGR